MNLKKYLPIENYTLTTYLNTDQVRERILENIEPRKTFRFSLFKNKPTKPYEGKLIENKFSINKIINYRNSFLPIITGNISSYIGQTQIHIKMRPDYSTIIFMSFWLGIVGLVCIGILIAAIFKFNQILENGFSQFLLIPFAMFVFGWLLLTVSFKSESGKSKEYLAKLLEGQEMNSGL